MKQYKVVSLFDGISTGLSALLELKLDVVSYDAFEIDDIPKKVSKDNFGDFINYHCDVRQCDGKHFKTMDYNLLIGGSSCQDLSSANGKQLGLAGKKSSIFWEYVRVWEQMGKPQFLFENVGSMPKLDEAIITEVFGCKPIRINSKYNSPALRNRLYWTNIAQVTGQPSTSESNMLQDVLEYGYTDRDKARALLASDSRPLATPVKMIHRYWGTGFTTAIFQSEEHYKACENHFNAVLKGLSAKDVDVVVASGEDLSVYDGIRYLTQLEAERCMTLPDGYTKCVTRNQALHCLGNGWTRNVIIDLLRGLE